MNLHRPLWLLPLLALVGCATDIIPQRDRAMLAGRYAEMETRAAAEVPDMATAKTAKLTPLCISYSKLKRYDKLAPCLDQLEKNVAAGDTNMTDLEAMAKQSPLMMGFAKMGSAMTGVGLEQDVSPFLFEMRAETYMELGDYARAVEYGRKMVAGISRQWNQERAQRIHALGELGIALVFAGQRPEAEQRARELEEVGTAYPYVLLKTDKLVFLARLHIALGHFQRAYEIISEDDNSLFRGFADLVSGGALLEGGSLMAFQQVQRRFMRHKCELETGRLKEAKAGYEEMLSQPAVRENGDIYWIVLYDRGRIAERENNPAEAIEFYRRAVDIIEQQRSTLNTEASKIGFVGTRQSVYQDLVRLLVGQGLGADAFGYVERSKARALVDMLASKQDFAVSGGDAQAAMALLARSASAEVDARVPEGAGRMQQTRSLAQRAQTQLAEQAPELASVVSVTALRAPEIQQRLGPSETLVEYYYGADQALYAFVVKQGSLKVHALDGAGLDQEVGLFRQAINKPASSYWQVPAQQLYERLWKPFEGELGESQITVVAHGALHYLPFNALHDGRRFVIERNNLRALPAASVLRFLKAGGRDKPGLLLALGNPDLGNADYDLPFAQSEAAAIAASLPRSRVLVRKEASKQAFLRYAPGFRYLHIAGHGTFNPEAPLQSALLLAAEGEAKGAEGGRLTVGELYSMTLDVDLVTLSACETGLGKITSGDDVVGLTRGFLYAGASDIVASLWQVDDKATGELMSLFYGTLRSGASSRDALRRAQLTMLQKNPHPFFWAAFQLTGS